MTPTTPNLNTSTNPAVILQPLSNTASTATDSTSVLRRAKLIMVTTANNNKYYEMQENTDDSFTVSYGRVGARGTTRTYSMREWEKKYREKVRKGYQDISALMSQESQAQLFKLIKDSNINDLMTSLFRYARKSIQKNYYVSAAEVSVQQVEAAQNILEELSKLIHLNMDHHTFNESLLRLFQIIPRRMTNVKDHLIEKPKNKADLSTIKDLIASEQETLDVMQGQVALQQQKTDEPQEEIDILQQLGIKVSSVKNKAIIADIKAKMGANAHQFARAFAVEKPSSNQRFEEYVAKADNKKIEHFWHGSRNENWMSILKTDLVLRPTNAVITGKMFGYGLYFADSFQKSLNYTSLYGSYWANGNNNKAYIALYDVHVGKQLEIEKRENWCGQLTEERLKKRDKTYDSVYAKKGVSLLNNEYIVYNEAQCAVRYLIELKSGS